MATSLDDCIKQATDLAAQLPYDVFMYNGPMRVAKDLECIEAIYKNKQRDNCLLILTTDGGDADAAYKIARYVQEKYKKFSVLIAGRCKSAGTLLAIGAHELVFTPYGELGPLDIQLSKVDRFDQLQSGLTITDSLNTLEGRALEKFYSMVKDYIQANNGMLSFASASKAAADFITQLYAPVFSRIDPEEVGARARSMRIAADYGKRLAIKSQNAKPNALKTLSETYSSHSFVIDQQEAEGLFINVRAASPEEMKVVSALDRYARFEHASGPNIIFRVLSSRAASKRPSRGASDGQTVKRGGEASNGADSPRAARPPKSLTGKRRGSRGSGTPAKLRGNGASI